MVKGNERDGGGRKEKREGRERLREEQRRYGTGVYKKSDIST